MTTCDCFDDGVMCAIGPSCTPGCSGGTGRPCDCNKYPISGAPLPRVSVQLNARSISTGQTPQLDKSADAAPIAALLRIRDEYDGIRPSEACPKEVTHCDHGVALDDPCERCSNEATVAAKSDGSLPVDLIHETGKVLLVLGGHVPLGFTLSILAIVEKAYCRGRDDAATAPDSSDAVERDA